MTVSSTPRKAGPFSGNDSTTAFPFTFKVFATGDIKVTVADADGAETVLTETTHYTVELNTNQETSPGGTVTYPASGSPLATGSKLVIDSDVDFAQELDLPSGGNFSPLAIENQLDRTTMQIQQLAEQVGRAALLPTTSDESVQDLTNDIVRLADSADAIDALGAALSDVQVVADNLEDVQAVAAMVDEVTNFADVYQGAKAEDPTTRNDGSALQAGDLYFSTVGNIMRVYSGSAWGDSAVAAPVTLTPQVFSGTGAETEFTLSAAPGTENNTFVYIAGVYQAKSQYSVSGTTLTFSAAPPSGTDNIEVVIVSPISAVTAAGVMFSPTGNLAATDVQAALAELDSEKQAALTAASQAEMEAGAEAALRSMSPLRVAQAITAQSPPAYRSAPVSLSGQTEVIQTGIPAWVTEVLVVFEQMSTSASVAALVQIGSASTMNTSSYQSVAGNAGATNVAVSTLNNSGFHVGVTAADYTTTATFTITKRAESTTTDTVCTQAGMSTNGSSHRFCGGGGVAATSGGILSRVRVAVPSGTFDGGTVTFMWR